MLIPECQGCDEKLAGLRHKLFLLLVAILNELIIFLVAILIDVSGTTISSLVFCRILGTSYETLNKPCIIISIKKYDFQRKCLETNFTKT